MILEVVFQTPVFKSFDYLCLAPTSDNWIGRRVLAPFGFRPMTGIVCGIKETSLADPKKLKSIAKFLDEEPVLSSELMSLGRWLSDRYLCSLGEALFFLLPPSKKKEWRESEGPLPDYLHEPHGHHPPSPFSLTDDQRAAIQQVHDAIYQHAPATFIVFGVAAAGKTEVYLEAIADTLAQGKTVLYLAPETGLAYQSYLAIKERFGEANVIFRHAGQTPKERQQNWMDVKAGHYSIVVGARSTVLLPLPNLGLVIVDEEQESSYKEDRKPRFHAREVAIERARMNNAVALLGSATPSLEMMHLASSGAATLLELSHRAVRTSAPEMTLVDMRQEKWAGLFSQTLKTALNECHKKGEQAILFLNKRGFHRFLRCPHCGWVARCPECGITLVEHHSKRRLPLTPPLATGELPVATSCLPLGEGRSIDGKLSLNIRPSPLVGEGRVRGQSSFRSFMCHYCAKTYPSVDTCPDCGKKELFAGGFGTQRVVEELLEHFPWARVLRWDRDAVSKARSNEEIFNEFIKGDYDVLVGTTLVAHGFNFPKVTLVGILDADGPLHIPDFRAAERMFQSAMQVAGRAGRFLVTGQVVIQTRHPDHDALKYALEWNTRGFAESELKFREELHYPPYSHLIEIKIEEKKKGVTAKTEFPDTLDLFYKWLKEVDPEGTVGWLGPKTSHRKTKGKIQSTLVLKVPLEIFPSFLPSLREFIAHGPHHFTVDIDPETISL